MLERKDILALYNLILERDPESDEVINEKRLGASYQSVAIDMLESEEFLRGNAALLKQYLS
ncbi:MAG: hypothetical protein ACK5XE_09760 [Burkholderiales bacterium]